MTGCARREGAAIDRIPHRIRNQANVYDKKNVIHDIAVKKSVLPAR